MSKMDDQNAFQNTYNGPGVRTAGLAMALPAAGGDFTISVLGEDGTHRVLTGKLSAAKGKLLLQYVERLLRAEAGGEPAE